MKIQFNSNQDYQLNAAFGGKVQLKTNTVLEIKSPGIEFRTV